MSLIPVSSIANAMRTIPIKFTPPKKIKIPVLNLGKLPDEEKLQLALKTSTLMNLQFLQMLKALKEQQVAKVEATIPEILPKPTQTLDLQDIAI